MIHNTSSSAAAAARARPPPRPAFVTGPDLTQRKVADHGYRLVLVDSEDKAERVRKLFGNGVGFGFVLRPRPTYAMSNRKGDSGKKIGVGFFANIIGWFAGGVGEENMLPTQLPSEVKRDDGRDKPKDYLYIDLFEEESYVRLGVGYTKVHVANQSVLDRIWSAIGWSGRLGRYRSAPALSVGRTIVDGNGKAQKIRSVDGGRVHLSKPIRTISESSEEKDDRKRSAAKNKIDDGNGKARKIRSVDGGRVHLSKPIRTISESSEEKDDRKRSAAKNKIDVNIDEAKSEEDGMTKKRDETYNQCEM